MKSRDELIATLEACFGDRFGESGTVQVALAPGRVNLIGEHTDYNEGWVLPMAIERYVGVAFRARNDRLLLAYSVAFDEIREIDLDAPEVEENPDWVAYVGGVAWTMRMSGLEFSGIDCVIDGDVPVGSGLSSSAAVEMAMARALCAASGLEWSPKEMARLGQLAEHRFVGIKCGLMDQLASAIAEPACAVLLDCRSMATATVPIPAAVKVVVMDTGVRRALAKSAYNDRRASCEAAVAVVQRFDPGVQALRDVDADVLEAARDEMGEETFRRAKHVVEENARPAAMANALAGGDLEAAGRLMDESHESLRDLYEVSSVELDLITDLARRHPACYGARLTGAGFGGCAVALVRADAADTFVNDVHSAYKAEVDLPSELFACGPAGGAHLVHTADTTENARPVVLGE